MMTEADKNIVSAQAGRLRRTADELLADAAGLKHAGLRMASEATANALRDMADAFEAARDS